MYGLRRRWFVCLGFFLKKENSWQEHEQSWKYFHLFCFVMFNVLFSTLQIIQRNHSKQRSPILEREKKSSGTNVTNQNWPSKKKPKMSWKMTISIFFLGKKKDRKVHRLIEICLQNNSRLGRVIDLCIKIFFEIHFYFCIKGSLDFRIY